MSNRVKAIPDGYEGITPYLICRNAEAAIEFYKKGLLVRSSYFASTGRDK